jgi:release factor glutamine methyltransferase
VLTDIVARLRAAGCVFAEEEAAILIDAADGPDALQELLERRIAGLPLEHVVGWAEFCGRRIAVEPGVFVPRRRTEFLVERAAARTPRPAVVLDLCCGSGALGAALNDRAGPLELYATDIEPAAVRCARRNVEGQVFEGDLFAPLPASLRGRIDVLLANVPYVPAEAIALMPPEAREYEPRVALDGGSDGLDVLRRVAADAAGWLAPGGCVLVEVGDAQVPAAVAAFTRGGFVAEVARSADESIVVIATLQRP